MGMSTSDVQAASHDAFNRLTVAQRVLFRHDGAGFAPTSVAPASRELSHIWSVTPAC